MDPYPTASDPAHDPVSDVAPGDRSDSERISAAPRGTPRTPSGDRRRIRSDIEQNFVAPRDTPRTPSGDRPGNRSEIERIPAATAEVPVPGPDRFPRVADVELGEDILTVLYRLEIGTMHRVQALVPSLGLTVREFLVLTELTLHPEGLTNGQVTGIVGLPSATVAELLTALEASGLVDRVDDPFDRRCIASFATERAQQMLVDARGRSWQIEDLQRELLRDLDVHQLDGVMRFLGRATDRAYRRSRQLRERPRPGRVTRGGSG